MRRHQSFNALSQNSLSSLVISDSNIRLLSISTQLGPLPDKKPPAEAKTKKQKQKIQPPPKILILEGIVRGERLSLEAALAGFLMELKNSPLFDQPTINKKSFEFSGNNEVLRFTARLNLA